MKRTFLIVLETDSVWSAEKIETEIRRLFTEARVYVHQTGSES